MNIVRLQGQCAFQFGAYYEFDKDITPIGEGGMGVLYLGARVHQASGARIPVVIKAIRDEIGMQAHLVQRLMREASVQIDNENLIRMYDFVSNYEVSPVTGAPIIRYYVVMEYLNGTNLDNILEGHDNIRGEEIPLAKKIINLVQVNRVELSVMLMRHLLSGVLALHNAGYIHRDLDPSNVMITRDGKVKIIDFGICKRISGDVAQPSLTANGSFMGKVQYAAPELILGAVNDQNFSTDIYALGIILYQLYMGRPPFQGITDQEIMQYHLKGKLPYRDIDNKDIQRIVKKATEVKQSARYQSAAEFLVDIERVQIPSDNDIDDKNVNNGTNPPTNPEVELPTWILGTAGAAGAAAGLILALI